MEILNYLVVGWAVLIVAIVLNYIALKLGIKTWYEFTKEPGGTNLLSYAWLFGIYPLALGLTAYVVSSRLS